MIQFLLNDGAVSTNLRIGSTVLDYVRYQKHLKGTKIGCREGDCGACTILVGDFENGELVYRSMTSCLMPLGNAHGKHILTVEGINMDGLSPVQQIFAANNGAQCGFCTIGFIMSLSGFVLSENNMEFENAIAAIDGNICRCTGYKSIERATSEICREIENKPTTNSINWLVENGFLPDYFKGIEAKMHALKKNIAQKGSLQKSKVQKIGGGTDLIVQRPESIRDSQLNLLFDQQQLKGLETTNGIIELGASSTVSEFGESPLIRAHFPNLRKHLKLVSSTPIRNMATLAGNIVNASPIGDMSIFFLALESDLVLELENKTRKVKLKDFFKAYKTIDLKEDEKIQKIAFPVLKKGDYFNFEKVSKRTHLDIASVNSACKLSMDENGEIRDIHLSAGGIAPIPKYLNETAEFLKGKEIDDDILKKAFVILNEEVAPISDARGSADYKRLLLRQLVFAHFATFFGTAKFNKTLSQ